MFTFNDREITKFWTYRSAHTNAQIIINVDKDLWEDIRDLLSENDCKFDNHICWEMHGLYFQYSDHQLFVGSSIKEVHW